MLKHKYKVAATILGVTVITAGMPVSAANSAFSMQKYQKNGIYVYVGSLKGQEFPGCSRPDIPEVNEPDNNIPGINVPDIDQSDNNESDINGPDLSVPDTDQPDNSLPDNDIPEQDANQESYAMQVVHLVNQERAKEGLPALQYDTSIARAAQVRVKETEISFSHTRPNGSSFSTALKEQGVSYRGAGENIAWGQKSPEDVMKAWMNSSGHRANIMNPNFTKIGVGYYQNSKGVNYWTQLFTY